MPPSPCMSQNDFPGQLSVDEAIMRFGFDEPKWTMHPQRHPGPISSETPGCERISFLVSKNPEL